MSANPENASLARENGDVSDTRPLAFPCEIHARDRSGSGSSAHSPQGGLVLGGLGLSAGGSGTAHASLVLSARVLHGLAHLLLGLLATLRAGCTFALRWRLALEVVVV